MIDQNQFRKYLIQAPLNEVGIYSRDAEELLIATAAQESVLGTYLHQESGPACGIYQMEPNTHDSLWNHFLITTHNTGQEITTLGYHILKTCNYTLRPDASFMTHNLWYASLMARVFYMDIEDPLPHHDDYESIWTYYKTYWNTKFGKATRAEFFANLKKCGIVP